MIRTFFGSPGCGKTTFALKHDAPPATARLLGVLI